MNLCLQLCNSSSEFWISITSTRITPHQDHHHPDNRDEHVSALIDRYAVHSNNFSGRNCSSQNKYRREYNNPAKNPSKMFGSSRKTRGCLQKEGWCLFTMSCEESQSKFCKRLGNSIGHLLILISALTFWSSTMPSPTFQLQRSRTKNSRQLLESRIKINPCRRTMRVG